MNVELLAPAGSLDILKAAVKAGADAIYVGGDQFSARKHAKNFSLKELEEGVHYAHRFQRKVFLAINTLFFNEEIMDLIAYLYECYRIGIDAFIIQDLGLYQLLKATQLPVELHGSTQMSIYNLEGARQLKKMGFDRVVLARETSLSDMATIRQEADIPCEVFIHGALCISYSGQCLMSSLIGGRSGNRGDCAQPCRQLYHFCDENNQRLLAMPMHLLSPKELSTATILPEILETGVDSLKIEGRMKSIEYVFAVTNAYRKLIEKADGNAAEYQKWAEQYSAEMQKLFNRSGFTTGFIKDNPYEKMMSYRIPKKNGVEVGAVLGDEGKRIRIKLAEDLVIGDGIVCFNDHFKKISAGFVQQLTSLKNKPLKRAKAGESVYVELFDREGKDTITKIYKTFDKAYNERIKNALKNEPKARQKPLQFYLTAQIDQPLELTAITPDFESVTITSDYVVQKAEQRDTEESEIREKLAMLGETDFYLDELTVFKEGAIFIPSSVLKKLRREIIAEIDPAAALLTPEAYEEEAYRYLDSIPPSVQLENEARIGLRVRSLSALEKAIGTSVDKIILDITGLHLATSEFQGLYQFAQEKGIQIAYSTGNILTHQELDRVRENLDYLAKIDALDGFYVSNLGMMDVIANYDVERCYADSTLNLTNDLALDFFMKSSFRGAMLSPELSLERLENISMIGNMEIETMVHGHIPAMTLKYDLLKSIGNEFQLDLEKEQRYKIENGHKDRYWIIPEDPERTVLVNEKPRCLIRDILEYRDTGVDHIILDFRYDEENIDAVTTLYQKALKTGLTQDLLKAMMERYPQGYY